MAMKTASPWWFSGVFAAGLFLFFLGERPFDHIDGVRMMFSGAGVVLMLGVTGLRVWTMFANRDERRAVERVLLFAQLGVCLALVLYALTTDAGRGLVGAGDLEEKALHRYTISMTVLWAIVLLCSLTPLLMIELSLGTSRRNQFSFADVAKSDAEQEAVESYRVREMATAGLTIGLAIAFLAVTCNVADQRNIRKDVSYFKTSSPGTSTVNIVKSVSEPMRVYLFFPEVNQVKNEIRGYFDSLKAEVNNLVIEEHDAVTELALAKQFKVQTNGTVVIAYGDKSENVRFTFDPEKARHRKTRGELRELDGKINTAMLKAIKQRRTAYLTIGHGELNDADTVWLKRRLRSSQVKRRLRELNYLVKDLGMANGLGSEIPDDASMVLILGPRETFLEEELGSISRYLKRGGRVLIALDPLMNATLGSLEGDLGVAFKRTAITDDKHYMVRSGTGADRRLIKTDRFSSHASVTTLGQARTGTGVAFVNAGSLVPAPLNEESQKRVKKTFVIKSMSSSFLDSKSNFRFDKVEEKRGQQNLVAAIEDPTAIPEPDGDTPPDAPAHLGMRAMVFADLEIFADSQLKFGGAIMFDDAIKWLGGEENLQGTIESEKDIIIEHTRNEDVLWFYSTIVGAPLFILGLGLWFGWWRRQRMQRRAS